MSEKNNERKKYEKPEVQRLTDTKAFADCEGGSGDDNCLSGATPSFCLTGMAF